MDSFELDAQKKLLRFELTVGADDDMLRFQTEPPNYAAWTPTSARPASIRLGRKLGSISGRSECLTRAVKNRLNRTRRRFKG